MNSRIYDPTLGRFLQADPHIQAPENSQSFNRYSYVLNNPLSYTDPSGYIFKKIFNELGAGKALRAIAKVPVLNAVAQAAACFYGGPAGCAAYSASSTYAVTGNFKAALRSGAIAFASAHAFSNIGDYFEGMSAGGPGDGLFNFGGNWLTGSQITGQIAAHALVGGISAELQGGKFGHGFFSAGFAKFAMGSAGFNYDDISAGAIASRTLIAAIVGGTASKISGGKFSNGAITAAMAQIFNAESPNLSRKAKIDAIMERVGKGMDLASKGNDILTIYKAVDEVRDALSVAKMQNELLDLIPYMSKDQIELLVPSLAGMPEPIIQKTAVLRLNNYYKSWNQTGTAIVSAGTDITTMVLTNMMPGGIARTLFALEIGGAAYDLTKED